ncbi:MAG TPA: GNAT family N-acetyltransferase [Nitrospira sp.]|nr:GNAT family N-acetyltransferase [Nitrospira sp.]
MTSADQVSVRPAIPEDLGILTEFSLAMAWETERRALDRSRLQLGIQSVIEQSERGLYFVANLRQQEQADTVTVGQLLITYEWSDWRNAQFWWIQSVFVHPMWRRKGIYRRMHQTITDIAHTRADVCGIRLYVEANNRMAKHVYQRVGLVPSHYEVYEKDFVLPPIDNTPNTP